MAIEALLEERLHYLDVECRTLSRRMLRPGLTAAHIVTAPSGVWVLATRHLDTSPATGGALSRRTQIVQLGNRTASRLVAAVARQADAVRAELDGDVPVTAILCILDADWSVFGGAFTVDDVRVMWPKKACEVIETGRVLSVAQIEDVHQQLTTAFPPAPQRHTMRSRAS